MSDPAIETARADVEAKREALLASAYELQSRLNLGTLAETAVERIRRKGEAEARKRPVTVALAAAGVAGLVVAGPLVKIAKWASGGRRRRAERDGDER
jgi:hypothetical protein